MQAHKCIAPTGVTGLQKTNAYQSELLKPATFHSSIGHLLTSLAVPRQSPQLESADDNMLDRLVSVASITMQSLPSKSMLITAWPCSKMVR